MQKYQNKLLSLTNTLWKMHIYETFLDVRSSGGRKKNREGSEGDCTFRDMFVGQQGTHWYLIVEIIDEKRGRFKRGAWCLQQIRT